jgi:alpha-1,2-mannosyltransferase
LLIALAAWWVFTQKAADAMPDFEVYWKAGTRAAAAEPLYREADADYQFKYFPAFAVLAIPIAALPLQVAKPIWFGGSVLALVVLLGLAARAPPDLRRPVWVLVLVAIVVLGKYYARDMVLGQINVIFTMVATGAIVAMGARREDLAGLLVAVAVMIKPYAVILLPWIAARRKAPSIIAAAAGVAAGLMLPAAIYGVDGAVALYRGWWTTVSSTTDDTMIVTDNISVAAMYVKWLGPEAPAWPAVATSALLVLIAVMVFRARGRVTKPDALEAALLLTLTPLISPQGWDYVVVVSTLSIMLLANYFDRLPRSLRPLTVLSFVVIGFTLFDLLGRTLLYRLLDMSVITLAFFVVVLSLAVLRARRVA